MGEEPMVQSSMPPGEQPRTHGEHPRMGPGRGRLTDKVAIVTGADSGIGRASARLFAREGAQVVAVDINAAGALRIDQLIEADGGTCLFVAADVAGKAGCEAMVGAALDHFGRVDILVNVVGTGTKGRLHEISDDDWHGVLQTNLDSVYYGVRAVLPFFLDQGSGVIVNMASTFGLLAWEAYPAYCASKAAIVNLTRQLALDYGPEIRVNCVCPGATASARILGRIADSPDPEAYRSRLAASNRAMRRLAEPEEIAYAMLFLASDEASFVTGEALVVDGGQTIDA